MLSNYPLICSLIIDEMAIRKHTEWDGKKFHGYVNLDIATDDDCQPIAKEAFVFLVVAVNSNWKIPVGYFLTDGLNSEQHSNLILTCLKLVHDTSVNIISLIFDRLCTNINMAKLLGCNFDLKNLKTTFPHPVTEIAVFLDPYHMIKLVRNTPGEKKIR